MEEEEYDPYLVAFDNIKTEDNLLYQNNMVQEDENVINENENKLNEDIEMKDENNSEGNQQNLINESDNNITNLNQNIHNNEIISNNNEDNLMVGIDFPYKKKELDLYIDYEVKYWTNFFRE